MKNGEIKIENQFIWEALLSKVLKQLFCSYQSESFHYQLKGSLEYRIGLNLPLWQASVCEREIRALLFSWNIILMLRIEFLRSMLTSFIIFETLVSICLSESVCGFVNILAQPSHSELFKGQKASITYKNKVSLYFWWRKCHLINNYI